MRRFMFLCALALSVAAGFVGAADAQTKVGILSTKRLTIGAGIERAWQFQSLDDFEQFGNQWFAKVPLSYSLPGDLFISSITARFEKSLTTDDVGARLGVQVTIYHQGVWMPKPPTYTGGE